MVEALVLDPSRVERLENEIDEMRKDMAVFIREATLSFKELRLGVDQVNGHVADVLMEIGTVPDHRYRNTERRTVTDRLHKLENDSAAAKIAAVALKASEETRAMTREQAWTKRQKIALFIIAVVGAVVAVAGLANTLLS